MLRSLFKVFATFPNQANQKKPILYNLFVHFSVYSQIEKSCSALQKLVCVTGWVYCIARIRPRCPPPARSQPRGESSQCSHSQLSELIWLWLLSLPSSSRLSLPHQAPHGVETFVASSRETYGHLNQRQKKPRETSILTYLSRAGEL